GHQDSRVVVEHVERAAGVRGELAERPGPLLGIADVEFSGDPGRVRGLHRGEGVRLDVVHADRPALAVEPLGRRLSDAGRSARDGDRCHVLLPRQTEFHGRGETSRAGTRAGACVDDTPPGAAGPPVTTSSADVVVFLAAVASLTPGGYGGPRRRTREESRSDEPRSR